MANLTDILNLIAEYVIFISKILGYAALILFTLYCIGLALGNPSNERYDETEEDEDELDHLGGGLL